MNCIQYKAAKKAVTEEDVITANKLGFGSKIGQITNRITCMTSLMANYTEEDEEYKILKYRTQCGQAQQQAEIDKAKGILPNPMPKSWYDYHANKIDYVNDSDEEKERKELYQTICAHKKPYFFSFNYLSLKSDYDKYMANIELKSQSMFKMKYTDLKKKEEKTAEEQQFIQWAENRMPLDMSPCIMNRICWAVEREMEALQLIPRENFDSSMIKSGYNYSPVLFRAISNEYKHYKKFISSFIKQKKTEYYVNEDNENDEGYDDIDQLREQFAEKCYNLCPNQYELCDILVDLCYKSRNDKDIVWFVCGDVIIDNLLKNNNDNMYYPQKVSSDGEFWCGGHQFVMKKIRIGGESQ